MPEAKTFVLDVETDPAARSASLRLSDETQVVLATHDVRLESQPASMWEALFETPAYLRRNGSDRAYGPPLSGPPESGPPHRAIAAELIEQIGVFLGHQVMGPAILGILATGDDRRSLLVRVSSRASKKGSVAAIDPLTSAFTRLPWHIARPALGAKPLIHRNVVVRVAPPLALSVAQGPAALPLEPGEPLRVLCVFVEAPGARPLAARLERERLRELFYDEIMPDNQVMLDIFCHGVTRERLRQKLQDAGGYHVIHWSGHGCSGAESAADDLSRHLSGAELAELLAEAGGFIPRLVFLSVSNAGPIGAVTDWPSLKTAILEPSSASDVAERTGEAERPSVDMILDRRDGSGDTALELLAAGVPQVVLTRHPAGCAYARRLARRFYRSLLAAGVPQPADSALALAQRELITDKRASEHHPADHASAIILGEKPVRFELDRGQSPDLAVRRPQPQPLLRGRADLEPPRGFSGRSAELARLATEWLPKQGAAVALVRGSASVGKTTFAAEAVHLWHRQFHWVMAFQARHPGLSLDDFYRELDKRLMRASPSYRERCKENEERRVYLPSRQDLSGPERYELLRDNLIDVLGSASILLILDGFEENLGSVPVEEGHIAGDPEWDTLLCTFVERLADVTGSRVLITSRYPIASLAGSTEVVSLELGPLLANEALSVVEDSEPLRALLRGGLADRELAWRVLETSAGHPPALNRLGDLAREGRALLESGVGLRAAPPHADGAATSEAFLSRDSDAYMGIDAPRPSIRTGPVSQRPVIAYPTATSDRDLPDALPIQPPSRLPLDLSVGAPAVAPPSAFASPPSPPAPPPPMLEPPSFEPSSPEAGVAPSEPPPRETLSPPLAVGPPDRVAQRAVALLLERLNPVQRSLLWRITRAPAPVPMDLIERMAEISP